MRASFATWSWRELLALRLLLRLLLPLLLLLLPLLLLLLPLLLLLLLLRRAFSK